MSRRMITLPAPANSAFASESLEGQIRCRTDRYGSVIITMQDRWNQDTTLYYQPGRAREVAAMLLALADEAEATLGVRKRA